MSRLEEGLRAAALRTPDRVAVVEAATGRTATYGELEGLASAFADRLRAAGVRPGDRVAFRLSKSIDALVALFGALGAGAAYVPLDPGAPDERTATVLARSGAGAVVTAGPSGLAVEARAGTEPVPGLAYVLFTSGSTGVPKGVAHTHESALAFVDWARAAVGAVPDDRFGSHAPLHFDLSIFDVFVPLGAGASVVLFDEALGRLPKDLARGISERGVTVWYSTPSTLRMLLAWGQLERHDYGPLRCALFAGEVLAGRDLALLRAHWRAAVAWNWYGPTETNVCTAYRIGPDDARDDAFPIGRAVEPDETRVLDGELCVRGATVMHGYWDDPEATERAFVEHGGVRWYRTGDLVREDPDGNYVFLGRRDRMVKRQGYRIELGDLEAALARHPAVCEVAVVARPHAGQGIELRAFLATRGGAAPSTVELRTHVASILPSYMLPDRFVVLDGLPHTSTGKVDYRALEGS